MSLTPKSRDVRVSLDELREVMGRVCENMATYVGTLEGQTGEMHLPNLSATVKKMVVTFPSPPPHDASYMSQWNAFSAGNRESLDTDVLRCLCWEPSIATSDPFLAYLWRKGPKLTSRPLAGLVRSCHSAWKTTSGTYPAAGVIKDLVKQYEGSSQIINKWKTNLNGLFGARGPEVLGRSMIIEMKALNAFFEEWYLDPRSTFSKQVVEKATAFCSEQFGSPTAAIMKTLFGELLPWGGWDQGAFKREVSSLILRAAAGQTRTILQKFVVIHRSLGDPRLPRNEANWAGMDPEARNRFDAWLAENPFALMERVYRQGKGWTWQRAGEKQYEAARFAGK